MTKYIENLNLYLDARKIKQNYLSMKTGIDAKKMSRILNGVQDITATDMDKIAEALGENTEYFLQETFQVLEEFEQEPERITFYAGEPAKEQKKIANTLLKLLENIDEVISAKGRFLNISR